MADQHEHFARAGADQRGRGGQRKCWDRTAHAIPSIKFAELSCRERCKKRPSAFPCWADDARTPARTAAAHQPVPNPAPKSRLMKNDQILSLITAFCRQADMAESTFGRRAVNDGKLVHRLREGKRITIDTLDRIQAYIAVSTPGGVPPPRGLEVPAEKRDPRGNFRFFENRQK